MLLHMTELEIRRSRVIRDASSVDGILSNTEYLPT